MRTPLTILLALSACGLLFGQYDYDAKILDYKGLKYPCSGTVTPKLLIRNEGNETMSGCVVETWKNGLMVNSFDWQLAVPAAQGESRQPVFPVVTGVQPDDELEFRIKTVNNMPDEDSDGNDRTVSMSDPFASTTDDLIEIRVTTDDSPGDLTWELYDALGVLVASGGPYTDAGATMSTFVPLASNSCFSLKGVDSGRGMVSGALMQVVSNGNSLLVFDGADLTAAVSKGVTTGAGDPCTHQLEFELETDDQPTGTEWSIMALADGSTVCTGSGELPDATSVSACCLADGCYRLAVTDDGGDGILGGGYLLRMDEGQRIIDNSDNFQSGAFSGLSGAQGFCLPLGTGRPIFSSCDKLDWVNNRFLVAAADPLVSAEFGVNNTTSGYEFWFFDPNGSYSYRRFRSHATSDGYGSGATRACHFKINGWISSGLSPHLPTDVLLNVRVRGRVAGVDQEFGPACRFRIDAARAACPLVRLQNDPSNTADFSCGVTREFGGANRSANRLVAAPPQFIPVVASGNVRYQFRFRAPGQCIVRPPQTSPTIHLNWRTGTLLDCGTTYAVEVRVSKDGGVTWCVGAGSTDAGTNCTDQVPWGPVCEVTIGGCPPAALVLDRSRIAEGTFSVFPNPVGVGRLTLVFDAVGPDVPVELELMDLSGRRVWSQRSAFGEGTNSLAIDLDERLSSGPHLLVARVGDRTFTERLFIAY